MNASQLPGAPSVAASVNGSADHFEGLAVLLQLKPLFVPLYALLTLVGVVGNSALIAVIARTRRLHTVTNFLIGNLSLSDLLVCVTCVPVSVAHAFEPRGWPFGPALCYFVTFMQPTTVYVSVLSLAAIAVDRYVVVAHPIRRRVSVRACGYAVLAIWLLSAALASPVAANTLYNDFRPQGHQLVVCEELWYEREGQRLAYSCSTVFISYMLPLSTISVSYCAITARLERRAMPGAILRQTQEKWRLKKRKTFRMLVLSALTFAICWLPLQTFNLIHDFDAQVVIIDKRYFNVVQLSCHWLAMSSTCYNPFIYASLHDKFKAELTRRLLTRGGRGSAGRTPATRSPPSARTSHVHVSFASGASEILSAGRGGAQQASELL
ncbi:prolactin-releasing peptide receptor-like [Lethenteron reissneri]|uniref:prolactin-releasing peptide receptor-like n=1 Tax=Lethenteron reissneri TaxID=7753 RepID=UPI002AB7617E|nr:prolactin-releasing peptide receptor-like [Lethenteron reissneri]XP_061429755.1 prolactin-releasing peptide receptor-like [Lethenteron reissneri]